MRDTFGYNVAMRTKRVDLSGFAERQRARENRRKELRAGAAVDPLPKGMARRPIRRYVDMAKADERFIAELRRLRLLA